ncbi:curli-like amyloid fiber formation chaperone CsgH [Flavobacterium frigidarium]|uniref:curli-like amyloid fiber formation chaperone CsgH n=1 Tax=Flavobacterium frigidarium TaxID=99286 RepID=UPI0004060EB7|nr:curli-like amyloid fiber formation chaperone CsgH [Flavobacterium frigidarium]
MIKAKPFLTLILILNSIAHYAQLSNTVVKAKIEIEQANGMIKVKGVSENLSAIVQSFSYKLTVIKKNFKSNNISDNSQEGIVTLDPNQTKILSETQLNSSNEDEITILLLFYDENKTLIGKDRFVLNQEKKK